MIETLLPPFLFAMLLREGAFFFCCFCEAVALLRPGQS